MNIPPQAVNKISKANILEAAGLFNEAEACCLEAIDMINKNDKATLGAIYINLGSIAGRADRTKDAIEYYRKAIEYLKNEKGEAILQNAHCHFNIAKIYFEQEDEAAIQYSTKALELYTLYPFTQTVDLIEARILNYLALAYNGKSAKEMDARKTWQMMKTSPFSSLNFRLVEEFLSLYLQLLHKLDLQDYKKTIIEIGKWADEVFAQEVSEIIEIGPLAADLKRKLRNALRRP